MGINLQKGQKIDLTKGNAGLKRLIVGLGWDALEKKGYAIDCDASAMMLDSTGKLAELIYFGNKKSKNGSVVYRMGRPVTFVD